MSLYKYQEQERSTIQISGHIKETEEGFLLQERWRHAATELQHAERVKRALPAYDLDHMVDVPFILSVIDGHGLFHKPIPAPMTTSKDIRRAAMSAANRLRRRIEGIRAGRVAVANDRERRLAQKWERLGPAVLQMEEEKIRCATYQTFRGGRIVPVGTHAGRRPERELTHALC